MRQRQQPASLATLVTQAERRLLGRRQLVGVRASELGRNLHTHLTCPRMLLLAGGLGFAVEHLTRHQAATANNTERPPRLHKLIQEAVKLMGLGRILWRAFSFTVTDSPVQSGSSGPLAMPDVR